MPELKSLPAQVAENSRRIRQLEEFAPASGLFYHNVTIILKDLSDETAVINLNLINRSEEEIESLDSLKSSLTVLFNYVVSGRESVADESPEFLVSFPLQILKVKFPSQNVRNIVESADDATGTDLFLDPDAFMPVADKVYEI